MSINRRKTSGLAIASLICGLFFLIPLIGALLGLIALILGIVSLVKIAGNQETLKGNALAIIGIVLGVLGMVIVPVLMLIFAIALPNILKASIIHNDQFARTTLSALSREAEDYALQRGEYPSTPVSLLETGDICGKLEQGYRYSCSFSSDGYQVAARPQKTGLTGSSILTVSTGGELIEKDKAKEGETF